MAWGVLFAIVVNYAAMAALSLASTGMSWTRFLTAHVRGLALAAATPVMTTVVLASVIGLPLLRPQLDRVLQFLVCLGAGVLTLGLYRVYLQRFGDLEGDLGGLVRSLFGFDHDCQVQAARLAFYLKCTYISSLIHR